MRTSGGPTCLRAAVAVVAAAMLLVGLPGCSGGESGAASCAAVLVYDGHTYSGRGGVAREPEVTGRSMPAVLPACDDTGGQSDAESRDEAIRVHELAAVDPTTAVFFNGAVYVRDGRELPERTRRWFSAPGCSTAGTFEVAGDWIGVTGPRKPRFDGDLRPPYRLEVHVTSGPARYVGARITVRATPATAPALTPTDVEESLWQGGQVTAAVRCVGGRFEALALRT
jgi:hypothetical protein